MVVRVAGEIVFNDSWFESTDNNLFACGQLRYFAEPHYVALTLRSHVSDRQNVLDIITRAFYGPINSALLLCEFKAIEDMDSTNMGEESIEFAKQCLAVKKWNILTTLQKENGSLEAFQGL
jgi:hypothetical protein